MSSLVTNNGPGGLTSTTIFPNLTLHNNSNSPADNDYIGGLFLNGEDSGSNETTYASIVGRIKNPIDKDGALLLRTNVTGTETTVLDFGDTRAGNVGTFSGDVNVEKANESGNISLNQALPIAKGTRNAKATAPKTPCATKVLYPLRDIISRSLST